tara:strand:+ start:54 stop:467 length:414 start_codon:yes stop_codon:yes gene_type:complete
MKIFCYNYDCEHNERLKKSTEFKYTKFWKSIAKKERCKGACSKEFCGFSSQDILGSSIKYKLALCSQGTIETCERKDCLQNKEGTCDRKEILIEKEDVHTASPIEVPIMGFWGCSCLATGVTGHMDWSRFAKQKDMF